MYGKLMQLLEEKMKDGKSFDPESKEGKAKADVLREIKAMMDEIEASKVRGMKKVTVAAPTQEGLEEGLEKAQEVVGEMPEMEDEMEGEEDDLMKLKRLAMRKGMA